MSLGEDRVRVKFNPSATGLVDQIKQKSAELIDLCDRQTAEHGADEVNRLWSIAQHHYEEAAMWAAKAATVGIPIKKPTIEELERLLNSEPQGNFMINSDGSISAGMGSLPGNPVGINYAGPQKKED